jgi:hypothetical protein
MALLFSLHDFGTTFATRERGAELRDAVLAKSADDSAVTIDCAQVTNVSYSFADEFVGKLSAESELDIDLANMAENVGRTVRLAQQRRTGVVAC